MSPRQHTGLLSLARVLLLLAGALCAPLVSRAAGATGPLVLTGSQATYSITSALLEGTDVRVQNVPPDGRPMQGLKDYIARRAEALAPTFAEATAVVTLTNALPDDPLYRYAREANIRIVDIDVAQPWSPDRPGAALAAYPDTTVTWGSGADRATGATAPFLWLSISNAIRMGDLLAHDLMALFPDSAAVIGGNLDRFKRSLLQLRGEYQQRLVEQGGDVVFALTGDLIYLTNDMGLLVDGYFIKQDVRWTKEDLAALTRHLRDHQIRIVLHAWQPSGAIQDAVRAGGARLVVLETGDAGVIVDDALAKDGLQQILRRNLEAISVAAAAKP